MSIFVPVLTYWENKHTALQASQRETMAGRGLSEKEPRM